MKDTENTAIDRSVADKFNNYFLKSDDVLIFLIRIMTADIFVMNNMKAVPPYSRAKTVGEVSGSANKTDKTVVVFFSNEFIK